MFLIQLYMPSAVFLLIINCMFFSIYLTASMNENRVSFVTVVHESPGHEPSKKVPYSLMSISMSVCQSP